MSWIKITRDQTVIHDSRLDDLNESDQELVRFFDEQIEREKETATRLQWLRLREACVSRAMKERQQALEFLSTKGETKGE